MRKRSKEGIKKRKEEGVNKKRMKKGRKLKNFKIEELKKIETDVWPFCVACNCCLKIYFGIFWEMS